jgi:type II secretory pathway pseudopilin PulG
MKHKKQQKAQVWIETMLYLLIGLALIATVLAFVRPKIQEYQDKIIIDQTREVMEELHQKITEVYDGGQGNIRKIEINIKKGGLMINPEEDKIEFILDDSRVKYSELDKEIPFGSMTVKTAQQSKDKYSVTLSITYGQFDLTLNNEGNAKTYSSAPSPYIFSIENKGMQDSTIQINIISIG